MLESTQEIPAVSAPRLPRCLWTFALYGPLFGYATVVAAMTIATADSPLDLLMAPVALIMAAPIGIPFAWLIGLIPALLVGVIYWALRAKADFDSPAAIALSIGCAAIVGSSVLLFSDGGLAGLRDASSWFMVVLPAVIATPLCAAIVERGVRDGLKNRG